MVTQRELLSLSPEVQTQVADMTIKRHIPCEAMAQTIVEEASDDSEPKRCMCFKPVLHATIEEIPDEDNPAPVTYEATLTSHMPAAFVAMICAPLPDTTIIANPYEAYLCCEHGPSSEQTDTSMVVATESRVLHSILLVVDGQDKVEAILNPGCQVVAMSEEVCNMLALYYDLTIRLHMVSANGGIDQALRLACNVPFLVSNITLYLQVHVLCAPSYDILLGCPFNILTQSIIRNYMDKNQIITIIDLNTGQKVTILTILCGSFHFAD